MGKCPNPVGYFTVCGDDTVRYPAACNSWTCEECGPKKVRRFLFGMNQACKMAVERLSIRWRALTLTLGENARNDDLMRSWHRYRASLRKAGYVFEYIWTKEFTKKGKLHLHLLISSFIPWAVLKYYWRLATKGTSFIVWISARSVTHMAAYMSKYMTKDTLTAPFKKGERRYGMSKGLRQYWPSFKNDDPDKIPFSFTYEPDDTRYIERARAEVKSIIERRKAALKAIETAGLVPDRARKKRRVKHEAEYQYSVDDKGRVFNKDGYEV